MEYLTEKDYEIAEKNGICRDYAYQRFYMLGWSRDKAITTPVSRYQRLWAKYKDISLVSGPTFYRRVREGMPPEEAANTPPLPPRAMNKGKGKFTKQHLAIAAGNGINEKTAKARVYAYRWPVELAITVPIGNKRPKQRRVRA